jgi:hypothetical protein
MKEWAITLLAVVGGYVVIRWFMHQQGLQPGQRASAGFTGASLNIGPLSTMIGIQSNVSPSLTSGVPVFNDAAIANGHGDQVAAAYHSNTLSTIPGTTVYSPAFGPNENQPTMGEIQTF